MMTYCIIAVTVLVSWRGFADEKLRERLLFWPLMIRRKRQYERFLTHGFIHADWMHLIFNMVTLFFFGRQVEGVLGAGAGGMAGFALFYLSAIVVASLPSWLRQRNNPAYRSLGASGGTSAVLFAFVLLWPWAKLVVFPIPLPIPAVVFAFLYIAYSIWMDRRGGDNISHETHLAGAVYGIVFMLLTKPEEGGRFLRQIGLA